MLLRACNAFIPVFGFVLLAVSAGHTFDENFVAEAKKTERMRAKFECDGCDLSGAGLSGMCIYETHGFVVLRLRS